MVSLKGKCMMHDQPPPWTAAQIKSISYIGGPLFSMNLSRLKTSTHDQKVKQKIPLLKRSHNYLMVSTQLSTEMIRRDKNEKLSHTIPDHKIIV